MQPIDIFQQIWSQVIRFAPNLLYAVVTLIVGYLVGHYLGKIVDSVLSNLKLNEKFEETDVGKGLKEAGYTFSGLTAVMIKLFIYILTILAALNFLELPFMDQIASLITFYLPRVIEAVIVFLVGIMVVNWITKFLGGVLTEETIIGANWLTLGIKYLLYIILMLMTLEIAQIATAITQVVAQTVLFTAVIGVGLTFALMVGLGFRDEAKVLFSNDLNVLDKGKTIKVGEIEGEIKRASLLTIELEAKDGKRIVLPKRKLLDEGFEILS